MNITKEQIDALNAVVTVSIEKQDYSDKVEKVLTNYKKTANVPGFRKGHVPMGMIKKQYGKAVLFDEVNKILQDALYKYIADEKLDILGNPLPRVKQDFDWDAENFSFEFELGLAPSFEVNLKPENAITHYQIEADSKTIDQQIERIGKQFGKLIAKGEILDQGDLEITGSFFNEEKNIDSKATFKLDEISDENRKNFVGKKIGDQLQLQTKGLFKEAHSLAYFLKVSHDQAEQLDVQVTFTLEEANVREQAEFNQELFDKVFPNEGVTSEDELRQKIKEIVENQYKEQADQHFLNEVTDYLVKHTAFDLPTEFLKKWLRTAGEKELSEEEANEEYQKSEEGLRYQLIEGKILKDNNLQVTHEELKNFANTYVKNQFLQYGMPADDQKQIENIASKILQNKEEIQRINQQLVFSKLLNFYKENVNSQVKKVTFDEFIKEVYKEE